MKLSSFSMLVAVSVAAASSAWARDITTTTGQVYHNAVVTKTQPDGIRIEHDDGVGFIDFQVLSEADRKEFGYDPAAYAAAQKDQASNDKRRQEYNWMVARQALYLAGKAAEASIAAGYPTPYDIAAPAPQNPAGTTIEATLETPNFSYDSFGSSGWLTWPYVPSTYISSPTYVGRYPRANYGSGATVTYSNRGVTVTTTPTQGVGFIGRPAVVVPPTQTTIGGTSGATFGGRFGGASSIPAAANRR